MDAIPFCYDDLSTQSIRLVDIVSCSETCIKIELSTIAHRNATFYEALSYRWGDSSVTESIVCNNLALKVTKSLAQCLRHLYSIGRKSSLWIDQLCLNQENKTEIGQQVNRMGLIYRGADTVIMWLGEDEEDLAFHALKFVKEILKRDDYNQNLYYPFIGSLEDYGLPGADSPQWRAIEALTQLEYFGRLWVLQEVQLARHTEMFWGLVAFKKEEIHYVLQWMRRHRKLIYELYSQTKLSSHSMMQIDLTIEPKSYFLNDLLPCSVVKRTTDPRDKIFAIKGIIMDIPLIDADYEMSALDVFLITTRQYIQHKRDLDIFTFVIHGKEIPPHWPSWVPMLNLPNGVSPPHINEKHIWIESFNASNDMLVEAINSLNRHVLGLRGFTVDVVKTVSPTYSNLEIDQLERICKTWRMLRYEKIKLPPGRLFIKELLWTLFGGVITTATTKDTVGWFNVIYLDLLHFLGITMWTRIVKGRHDALERNVDSFMEIAKAAIMAYLERPFGEADELSYEGKPNWISHITGLRRQDESEEHCIKLDGFRDQMMSILRSLISDHGKAWLLADCVRQLIQIDGNIYSFRDLIYNKANKPTFTTGKGFFGLGPRVMKTGDIIVLLLGGRVPYVLRPESHGYRLVGECYVNDLMHGNLAKLVPEGSSLEEFQKNKENFYIH